MAERASGEREVLVNFEILSREFYLNGNEIKKRVKRTLAIFAVSFLILCVINFQVLLAKYGYQLPIILLVVFTFISFSLLTKSALSKVKLKISFANGKLKFPYYYIWYSEIPFGKISSLEEVKVAGDLGTIIVGFKNGGLTYFEKGIFSCSSHFYEFQDCLLALVKRNSEDGLSRNIDAVEQNLSHIYIQVIIIFMWIATLSLILFNFAENFELILEKGALSRKEILGGEVYRIFSSFFLHSSIVHVAVNVLVFSALSQSLLRLVDIYRYLNTLLISSLFASFATLVMHSDEFVVGASGGIFGLFGAFCAVKMARKLPGSISFISDISVFLLIGIEVVFGALNDRVDVYSHIGGFVAGFVILRQFLGAESSDTIYSSGFFGRLIAIALSVISVGSLFLFFIRIYLESA